MTDLSVTSPVERVARVIAAEALSANAQGEDSSASGMVDAVWSEEIDRARAVLRTLREPTPAMVHAGQGAGSSPAEIWSAMIQVALKE
ncbi:hypothetical protein [Sphingomonas soli]|uniref:hypothetical protein n=1 Tax=Sphingomonas soli TaxID=266127 RepID=UPI00082DC016|nr:hypothetical protein [Sphingomonas soli]